MRSAVAVHAAVSYVPAAQAPVEHASHAVPLQNKPGLHALHTALELLVQLTDEQPAIVAHVEQARSASAEQAAD